MKKIFGLLIVATLLLPVWSCTQDVPVYSDEQDRLGFEYDRLENGTIDDSVKRFTFVYESSSVVLDTVLIDVRTAGFVRDYDRKIKIAQVDNLPKYKKQAVAGVHYVPLNEVDYVVKAGENRALLPIIVKRDTSLQNESRFLTLEIQNNEFFEPSFVGNRKIVVEISDVLTKPASWNFYVEYYWAGSYGPVKHRFMIDALGFKVDEEWMYKINKDNDSGYYTYLGGFLAQQLKVENERRVAAGLDVLREAPAREGVLGDEVYFVSYGTRL